MKNLQLVVQDLLISRFVSLFMLAVRNILQISHLIEFQRRTRVLQLNASRISGLRVSSGGGAHSNALYFAIDKKDAIESTFENSCV